jgi:flavin-dependent dehydrogenase
VVHRLRHEVLELRAQILVAAHGSWDAGQLPTQPERRGSRASDLFGFKARFLRGRLPAGLMPLIAFPGGYGGMVHSDRHCVSLSCCIRRDRLEAAREEQPGVAAGDAVLSHIQRSCEAVRDVLGAAVVEEGGWRAAGPIRPGVRSTHRGGVFLVGNAAGEAHPVVAEGISMAMQSAWLLSRRLIEQGAVPDGPSHDRAALEYAADWRRAFAFRIRAASFIAHWAMRPAATAMTMPLLHAFPAVLTAGARSTGKVTAICSPSF